MSKKEATLGTMVVIGEGEVRVKPDLASIQLGVTTQAPTAQQAVSANGDRMGAVVSRMKALGIGPDDMQTGAVSVAPIVSYEEGPNKGKITGYSAENTLLVRCAVEMAGRTFDEGVAAGANQSSGLSFGLKDERTHRDEALRAAIRASQREAELVAAAAGIRLGGPRSIEVVQGGGGLLLRRGAEADAVAGTPILPGTLRITARVNAVYEYLYGGVAG